MRARCSEKAAECDVRIPEKRPGAGLMYVLCTIYGRHECRRPRTRQGGFELKQREIASAPRIGASGTCHFAEWQRGGLKENAETWKAEILK